jgi:hypothetical protein
MRASASIVACYVRHLSAAAPARVVDHYPIVVGGDWRTAGSGST